MVIWHEASRLELVPRVGGPLIGEAADASRPARREVGRVPRSADGPARCRHAAVRMPTEANGLDAIGTLVDAAAAVGLGVARRATGRVPTAILWPGVSTSLGVHTSMVVGPLDRGHVEPIAAPLCVEVHDLEHHGPHELH